MCHALQQGDLALPTVTIRYIILIILYAGCVSCVMLDIFNGGEWKIVVNTRKPTQVFDKTDHGHGPRWMLQGLTGTCDMWSQVLNLVRRSSFVLKFAERERYGVYTCFPSNPWPTQENGLCLMVWTGEYAVPKKLAKGQAGSLISHANGFSRQAQYVLFSIQNVVSPCFTAYIYIYIYIHTYIYIYIYV